MNRRDPRAYGQHPADEASGGRAPIADLMPAVERLVEQTERVPDVARAVEQIRDQAEPLPELLAALNS